MISLEQEKTRRVLIVLFVFFMIAGVTSFSRYNIKSFERATLTRSHESLGFLARSEALRLQEIFKKIIMALELASMDPPIQDHIQQGKKGSELAREESFLLEKVFADVGPVVGAVYRIDINGIVQQRIPFKAGSEGADYSEKPGVKTILARYRYGYFSRGGDYGYVSKVFKSGSGRWSFSVCFPVFKEEKMVGVFRALIPLSDLNEYMARSSPTGKKGTMQVIDNEGTTIISPVAEYRGGAVVDVRKLKYPQSDWSSFEKIVQRMQKGETGFGEYFSFEPEKGVVRQRKDMAAFASLSAGEKDWSLSMSLPYSGVEASIRKYARNLFVVIEILIFFFLFIGAAFLSWERKSIERDSFHKTSEVLKIMNKDLRTENEERKRAEKLLLKEQEWALELVRRADEANKFKSNFLANMSHEIRTPMNTVLGFSQLIKRTKLTEKQKEFVDMIIVSGSHLLDLINNILDFSKMEAGRIQLEEIDFNLEYMMEDIFKIVQPAGKDKKIEWMLRIKEDVPLNLKGDPTRLRQILINLLGNAVKFSSSQGVIAATIQKAEAREGDSKKVVRLRFSVKDNGVGIEPDKLDAVFDMFSQEDSSITRHYGGTGLGLAISKGYIELMDGKIWVESEKGKGSDFVFVVRLGVIKSVLEKEIDSVTEEQLVDKRVWIVDNNIKDRKALSSFFESMGMQVDNLVSSGQVALENLEEYVNEKKDLPDLILVDLMMPGMSGYSFTEQVKEKKDYDNIRIIALGLDDKTGSAKKSQEAGCDGFLTKPIQGSDLLKVVCLVMGDYRKEKQIITRHMAKEFSCKGLKILVAEDHIPNQTLLKAFFSSLGCEGDFVNNGQKAVEMLKKKSYDLCLMDIQMPVMGGFEATRIIRKEVTRDMPILAVTANIVAEDREEGLASGINDFIYKPVQIKELRAKILKYVKPEKNSSI